MKKRLITILILLIVISVSFAFWLKSEPLVLGSTVRAVGDLTVDWGVPSGNPIFVVSNWLPGDSETRSVVIKNNSSMIRPVGVRGVKVSEVKEMSKAVDFLIIEGANNLYGIKTLKDFFNDSGGPSGVYLFDLAPGEEKTVDFYAHFQESAGDDYQNAEVIFDLIIGISVELPVECENINLTGAIIYGTADNDKLNGTNKNDIILGFEGKDTIEPSNGDDCVMGGAGADNIKSNNGNDVYDGGEGNDKMYGGNGRDVIYGGEGNDTISGGNHDDRLFGGPGNDKIKGNNHNDYIEGNEGVDSADGDQHTDTCEAETETSCEL